MRGMTALYHRFFFRDVWLTGLTYLVLLLAADLGAKRAAAALPFVALLGAVMTAFDASYLVFARQYSIRLERLLNETVGQQILVGGELEDVYLFRLDGTKVVTIGLPFTWFGFVTVFLTALGAVAYAAGVALAIDAVAGSARLLLVGSLGALTAAALAVGIWWFVAGVGERRLREVLDRHFG
ncbi:MAG TPA: hypothetical protein VK960_05755 [Acidimicrobiia bacterium]|nr:hypothetical protein [Acidimicrobiia bacterium]